MKKLQTLIVFVLTVLAGGTLHAFAQKSTSSPATVKAVVPSPTPTPRKASELSLNRMSRQPERRTGEVARPGKRRDGLPGWTSGDELSVALTKTNEDRARELFEKARTLLSQAKPSEALGQLLEAEKLEPSRYEIAALQGVAYAILRQYDDAIKAFQRSIKLNPRNADLHGALCRALSESDRTSEAIEECKVAVELEPDKAHFKSQLAGLYLLNERSGDALQLLGGLYTRSQNDIVYLGTLGDAYYINGDYARAAEIYEKIAESWPSVSLTYLRLAGVYDYLDKGAQAVKAARKFAELEPKLYVSHFSLGMALKGFGFFDEAIEPLSVAKSLRSSAGEIYLALSECYEILGDKDNALSNLRYAYENLPPSATLAYRFGNALIEYGNLVQAVEPLERANTLSPNIPEIMRGLGLAYIETGQSDKGVELIERAQQISPLPPGITIDLSGVKNRAQLLTRVDEFLEAVKRNPADVRARNALAEAYLFKGMYDEAEQQYLEIIRLTPDYRNYNGLGIFYTNRGQFEKSVEAFKKAIELNPHHVLYISLSFALSKLGRADEALAAAKRSVEIKSTLLESRILLGDLYLKKGQREDALREYQAAFDLNPADPRPNFRLAWLYIRMGSKEAAFRHYGILKGIIPNRLSDLELSLRGHFGQLPY